MRQIIAIFILISIILISSIFMLMSVKTKRFEIKKINYEDHTYINFYDNYTNTTSFVHDPKCKCNIKNDEKK
jgi:hypothetical protein